MAPSCAAASANNAETSPWPSPLSRQIASIRRAKAMAPLGSWAASKASTLRLSANSWPLQKPSTTNKSSASSAQCWASPGESSAKCASQSKRSSEASERLLPSSRKSLRASLACCRASEKCRTARCASASWCLARASSLCSPLQLGDRDRCKASCAARRPSPWRSPSRWRRDCSSHDAACNRTSSAAVATRKACLASCRASSCPAPSQGEWPSEALPSNMWPSAVANSMVASPPRSWLLSRTRRKLPSNSTRAASTLPCRRWPPSATRRASPAEAQSPSSANKWCAAAAVWIASAASSSSRCPSATASNMAASRTRSSRRRSSSPPGPRACPRETRSARTE
mmetsp:Transcript_95251/g.308498  ORF Transcript_95251/g.308498 Transcript_95251/m.308498 type:complete len:341 (+) Transcript_95251:1615-2637(+)